MMATDDALQQDEIIHEDDDAFVHEQITNDIEESEEDCEFHHIESYRWEDGILIFNVILQSGKEFEIPFNLMKKDRPLETAKFIKNNMVETRGTVDTTNGQPTSSKSLKGLYAGCTGSIMWTKS